MDPLQLTRLELALTEAIGEARPSVAPMLRGVRVYRRDFDGTVLFSHFTAVEADTGVGRRAAAYEGRIEVPGVPKGLGAVFIYVGDQADFLLIYPMDKGDWDGRQDQFQLRPATEGAQPVERPKHGSRLRLAWGFLFALVVVLLCLRYFG